MIRSYDKKYLKIALPAALEGLFMILLASADLIMVGTLGAVSIAAVSIFLQPRLVILCFTRSLASSVTLLVSRDAGRNDRTNASDILKNLFSSEPSSFCSSIVSSICSLKIFSTLWAQRQNICRKLSLTEILRCFPFLFLHSPSFSRQSSLASARRQSS